MCARDVYLRHSVLTKSEAYFKKGCQRGVAVADMNCKQVDSHGGFRAINICAAAHGYNGQQKL